MIDSKKINRATMSEVQMNIQRIFARAYLATTRADQAIGVYGSGNFQKAHPSAPVYRYLSTKMKTTFGKLHDGQI